jgi:predicted phosphodiesterase
VKIAVISDIHANAHALRAVLDAIEQERVDRIVCLGDVAGYNTDVDPCVALLQASGALCIAGNHDRAVIGAIGTDGFTEQAKRAVGWTQVRLGEATRAFLQALPLKLSVDGALVAVHGALHPDVGCELVRLDDDRKRALSFDALAAHPSGARVCAFGHTHRPGAWERDGAGMQFRGDQTVTLRPDAFYLVNPGSVGESRTDDERASFLVFDTAAASLRFHRVAYDRRAVLAKTRKAGLGPRFGWIPPSLRLRLIAALRRVGLYEPVVVGFRRIDKMAARFSSLLLRKG